MLFNPEWDRDCVLGPISLRSFIAWLEIQPPNLAYDYCDATGCALGQFQASLGLSEGECVVELGFLDHQEPWQKKLDAIVITDPPTFGAALERARAALAS